MTVFKYRGVRAQQSAEHEVVTIAARASDILVFARIDRAGERPHVRFLIGQGEQAEASHVAATAGRKQYRLTPVSLAVMDGNHAWVLNGFTATADPAVTSHFTVTSVRVTGPLYGRQSVNGYDMPPDARLTTAAFSSFFTPFHYARVHMVWEGRYVTIQP